MPQNDNTWLQRVLFTLFFISGFCGLLYQVVWVRLAFASFGIVTHVLSVVLSVFMLGLALGSWAGGRAVAAATRRTGLSAIQLYALAEFGIGLGALAVPELFRFFEARLLTLGDANSAAYLAASAVAIALAIFPWCVFMGSTFPLMMGYVKERDRAQTESFSFLYFANVLGATLGALLTATVLVELLGFQRTLYIAGGANLVIALTSLWLARVAPGQFCAGAVAAESVSSATKAPPWTNTILFTTGFASLAMEVVWARSFTPIVGAQVYSFAALLVIYLVATWVGSQRYRRDLARGTVKSVAWLLAVLALVSFLPVLLNDPRLAHGGRRGILLMSLSIFPLCAVLGYLTPRLIDLKSGGSPRLAGRAYALNVLGCILGPLAASYLMLPWLGAKFSLLLLALPLVFFAWLFRAELAGRLKLLTVPVSLAFAAVGTWVSVSHEDPCSIGTSNCEIRRDHTATVVSLGEGMARRLLVNGVGITELTPITKHIAHLPLAFLPHEPKSGLVICFGMGTTYRSLLTWDLPTTAVELVPSVREAFPFYHADAHELLASPLGRVVIDDGRRYLNRSTEMFDVIVIDPPPPVEAAGSSLLYSREFHQTVKRHLKPGGIFQSWFPGGEKRIEQAIARSLAEEFPYVKVYGSIEGWGVHYLASMTPLPTPTAEELFAKLPPKAQRDLEEWAKQDALADLKTVLAREVPLAELLPEDRRVTITDDHPYNEYYLLRRRFQKQ
jgi:predicted membrane-bound spermidine synthase